MHIDLLPRLDIAGQTDNFLLGFRHRRYATIKFGFFVFQRLPFLQQRAVRRMNFGVQLGDFRLFKGQFVQLRVDVHHRIEHRFCFQRQINRIFILTEGIQFVFGNIKAATYFRQLLREEGEAFRRFRRFALNILLLIVTGDAVKNVADLFAIFTGISQAQYACVFAVLRYRQAVLQLVDHPQRGVFGDGKLTARAGVNGFNHQRDAFFFQHLARLPTGA